MDAERINILFHSVQLPDHYTAKIGESIIITLPRIPLTRYTEFLQVEWEKRGDTDCFIEEASSNQGEGSLLPRQIYGRAACQGKLHIVLNAKNRISGEMVPGVKPLDILVEVI